MPPPQPRFRLVFSAFSVGLFANAVLPGRIGELARVAVLTRRMARAGRALGRRSSAPFSRTASSTWSPVIDPDPLRRFNAKIPAWAVTSLIVVVAVGVALFTFAFIERAPPPAASGSRGSARSGGRDDGPPRARRDAQPAAALCGRLFQCLGWIFQLLAVYTAMRAFDIHAPLPAAGLVLVLMNVATIFPLWPGQHRARCRPRSRCRSSRTASPMPRASRSGSGCRRSRRRSGSGSA